MDEEKRRKAAEKTKAWQLANPDRDKAMHKAYAIKNKERIARYKAEWQSKNKDRLREKMSLYYESNKEEIKNRSSLWAINNSDRVKHNQSEYRIKNSIKRCEQSAKRRSAIPSSTPTWANEFFLREAYSLARLRTKTLGFKWHVDHIVPLNSKIVCGLHVEYNLQVIPGAENLSKGNRHWPNMP